MQSCIKNLRFYYSFSKFGGCNPDKSIPEGEAPNLPPFSEKEEKKGKEN
jgi:hypothetical protein